MTPEISVVIPTRNRRDRLRACLESLAQQTLAPDRFEVVVVVDGSTDGTEEMLGTLSTAYALRAVMQAQSGQGAARNLGVQRATGRFVIVLDDDMLVAPGFVAAHLEAQQRGAAVVGVGFIDQRFPSRPSRFVRWRAEEWRRHYDALTRRPLTFRDAYSGNLSVSRALYLEVGGYAVELPVDEDTEFAFRLSDRGATFAHVRDAVATEDYREDRRSILDKQRLYGCFSLELYRRHPSILPWLPLGGRGDLSRNWLALRAILVSAHVPPTFVAWIGGLLPGRRACEGVFRLAYSHAYWTGVRSVADRDTWRRLRRGILILVYHAIGGAGERPSPWVVPLKRFEWQMSWLRRRGYTFLSLDEYLRHRVDCSLPPPKSVVITFDDGYRDNLSLARPILERLNVPATIFLVSAAGDRKRSREDALDGRPLLSLKEARQALGGVVSFGAHSRMHQRLSELPPAEVEREVVGSKRELEEALGEPVRAFAYPYGKFDDQVKQIVARAGFIGACSVVPGRNRPSADVFALKRVEIHGTFRRLRFVLTVWLGDLRRKPSPSGR